MFRTVGDQPSLFESVLPQELLRLPAELERVDALLDDPAFFTPFLLYFDPRIGRPSTPMETYLRLMFLKFRYRLGYESLCREVSDSITWRRFCRIPLDGSVPHPTTLMKLTTRCGPAAVDGLNEALLAKATEAKVLRTTKLRADTTVVPSNVSYPTDSGLLAKAIRRIALTGKRIQAAGGATRTTVRDRTRAAGKRAHAIGFKLRSRSAAGRDEALAAVRRTTGELADLAETAATDAERLLTNAKHALRRARAKATALKGTGDHDGAAGRRRGRLARAIDDLEDLVTTTRQIAAQTRQRLAGQTPNGATRRVSLHDPDARPIAKGRLGKPVEFGHKVQLVEGDDGVIVDHNVERGNPADAPQLAPAVDRVRTRAGGPPRTVTADRGYGEKAVEDDLRDLGVRNVVIPRKGKPSAGRRAAEHRPAFRRTIKWRTGVEGRISALKRGYGWDRTRIDGTEGAQIWVGHGVLAHNLVKISTLAA
ncbi:MULTISPECIES: ISNCY family transposase [Rhodococcus]|uniref:ISNCY family transposase n=1 Tax=Rhodococcus TaxID=1827 RepID=UPI0029545D2E|nr:MULTISPECIES: ISNCY family transposase [Rhodococcus]MDV7246332.1 ISNCY family transposase [Rhodococcus oxybenzonivorans]MDV7337386.1 ISNCY family transposase [Rhodococcus oxybenzonivorans]MDV7348015.1 ISNCY family transposase [Rhodococcus oxybenzonivorans]MDV8031780.1 ISNCY family transposase [Rhodococcus sp. IEGM 27]